MQLCTLQDQPIAALVRLWNDSAPHDPIDPRRFRDLFVLDPNFDPAGLGLAVADDRVIGACLALRRQTPLFGADLEPDTGWLSFVLVDPAYRRRGVARRLIEQRLRWLHDHGVHTTYFSSTTPHYFLPGLDAAAYPAGAACLAALGFTRDYEATAMQCRLTDYQGPATLGPAVERLTGEGYRIGSAGDDDLAELIALAREQFSADWARAIREAVLAGLPLDRIMVVREPAGRLVGWAMHEAYEHTTERFGPFGVLERCRGTGLGTVLLHLTLQRMKAAHARRAWFLWTTEDSAGGRLYRRAGFEVTRRFQVLRHQRAVAVSS